MFVLKGTSELNHLINGMSLKVNQISSKLIRYLRLKDKLSGKMNRNCDILTAFIQATSLKRSKSDFFLNGLYKFQ